MFKSNTHGLNGLKQKLLQIITFASIGVILILSLMSFGQGHVQGAPSTTLNFQARLLSKSGSLVPDGNYHIEFKFYDHATNGGQGQGVCSGNCVWSETRSTGNLVTVKNGFLSVNLGSVTAFGSNIDWSEEHWMTMRIGGAGGAASWDSEMTPRIKLTAVPYAFQAKQLAKTDGANTGTLGFDTLTGNRSILLPDVSGTVCLQGAAACGFVSGSSGDFIQNGTSLQSGANFNIGASTGVAATITGASGQDIFTLNQNGGTAALTVGSAGDVTMAGDLTVNGGDITIGPSSSLQAISFIGIDGLLVTGGDDPGSFLTLQSTSDSSRGAINLRDRTNMLTENKTITGSLESQVTIGSGVTFTLGGGTGAFRGLIFNPTVIYDNPWNLTGGRSFEDNATLKNPSGVTKLMAHHTSYFANTTIQGDGAQFTSFHTAFLDSGKYDAINGGSVIANRHMSFEANLSVGANTTVVDRYGLDVGNAAGAGLVTNQYGVYVEDLTKGTNNYGIYIQGADTYALWVDSGATRLDGTLEVGTLGATDTDAILCRNSLNQLAGCTSTPLTDTTGFIQGGNSFGGTAILGTNDTNDLQIRTAGVTRLTIDAGGDVAMTGNISVAGNTTLGDASTDGLTITGTAVTLPNNLNFDSDTLFIDAANNRIGMGTAAPDERLHIVGNIKAVGSMAVGNGTTGAVAPGVALRVMHTVDAATDPFSCLFGCYAMAMSATIDNSNSAISGMGVGMLTGVSTAARAFTLNQGVGLLIGSATAGTGSTIANNYGIYIQNQTVGTNDYGIYIAGADTNALWVDSGATRLDGVTTIGVGLTSGVALTVNNGTSTSNILNIQDNGTNVLSVADGGNVGIKTGANAPTADLTFGDGANRTINVLTRTTAGTGYNLSILAGAGNGSNNGGGILNLQGGSAGSGNANGGNVLLSGGAGVGTGAKGLVVIDTPTITTSSTQVCSSNCNILAASVNNSGAVLISATATGVTASLPDPTITTAGRLMYVTNVGSNDFILSVNGGGTSNTIAMKPNTTATMIWNGDDWTAAGASSSTDLQSAYNNTLTSAGGAELVLNAPGGSADGLTIRNNPTTPIEGGILEVQSSIGTNLFSVNSRGSELAANGGAETSATFGTNWSAAPAGGSVARTTTSGQYATGQAGVQVSTTGSNHGVRNNLSGNPAVSTTYQVSFTAKLSSGTFNTLEVVYSRNGGTNTVPCSDYSSQTLSTAGWTKITCTITTDGSTPTNPDLIIRQTDATSRTFWIDNLSFMRNDASTQPSNVQIGGGIDGGQITLFTLDRSTAPPVADGDETYLGSMYYDTNTGRIQCYESDGWGACGSAPDNIITLTPEYTGAVLNGSGIGTMTADFCSNDTALQVNTAFCASGISRNYYRWTSPQASEQEYSIYVSYKLPNTFKEFQDANTIKLTALTDSMTNGEVGYEVFRSTGSNVTSCGSETIVTTPSANTWYTKSFDGDETTCGFAGGNYIIFKINVRASSNASVYVENLDFTYMNQ